MFHGIKLPRWLEQSLAGSSAEGDALKKSGLSMVLAPVSARAPPIPRWLSRPGGHGHLSLCSLHRKTPEVPGLPESDGLQGQS